MKGFFAILLVVCGLLAAGWFFYEPYVKPLLSRFSSGSSMADSNRVINTDEKKPVTSAPLTPPKPAVTPPVKPATTVAKPAEKPVVPVVAAPKSELEQLLEARYPMPQILPLLTIVDQWRNVPPNAYPPEVTAKETIPFELVINGQVAGSSNVAPGTPLKPVRLEGGQLVVASLVNPTMSKSLAVEKTDFKERIEARYNQFVEMKLKDVEAKRERARQMIAADPSRLAILTGKPAPAPTPGSGEDPRFAAVKDSLKKGQAASVTLEEANSFIWNGSEKIGGEYAGTYDTVSVHFVVSTIFGKFPTEYKALLKGGQVVAWIDPVTEDRI